MICLSIVLCSCNPITGTEMLILSVLMFSGVDGRATMVESLDDDGATLSSKSIPLTGADITGLPFSAAGITINAAMAMSPGAMGGAMSPDGMGAGAMGPADEMSPDGAPDGSMSDAPDGAPGAGGGFGTVLPGSTGKEGDLNFDGPVCS